MRNNLCLNDIFFDDDFFAIEVKLTHPNLSLKKRGTFAFFSSLLFVREGVGG
jgi:hypothetical protein